MAKKKTPKENPEEPQNPIPPQTLNLKKEFSMKPSHVFSIVIALAVLVIASFSMTNIFENLDASKVMVIQSPVSGDLTWHITPGLKYQGFGKVSDYSRRSQFWFSSHEDQGKKADESLEIRFNDGAHAKISGGLSWEMPLTKEHLTQLHQKYGSVEVIQQQLIKPLVEKAVTFSGVLISSTESYASRKNELLHFIEDQITNGIYQTKTIAQVQKDPITGAERSVKVVQLVLDKDGTILRNDKSPLQEFKIRIFNFVINQIKYDPKVEEQIQQQQQSVMQVEIAIVEAKKSEQQLLTTIKEGQSLAAKAEWVQKTISAKLIAEAQQKLDVAKLDVESAKEYKTAEITRAEADSIKRKMILEADGALEKKLEAFVEINKAYASAIGVHKNQLVPSVVMGANAQAGNNNVQSLIDLFIVKTAKELGLEFGGFKQK